MHSTNTRARLQCTPSANRRDGVTDLPFISLPYHQCGPQENTACASKQRARIATYNESCYATTRDFTMQTGQIICSNRSPAPAGLVEKTQSITCSDATFFNASLALANGLCFFRALSSQSRSCGRLRHRLAPLLRTTIFSSALLTLCMAMSCTWYSLRRMVVLGTATAFWARSVRCEGSPQEQR